MRSWPTKLAAALRRAMIQSGGQSENPRVKLPQERPRPVDRMPRVVSFARVVLVLVTDPRAERWLPPKLGGHAKCSDDFCVLS